MKENKVSKSSIIFGSISVAVFFIYIVLITCVNISLLHNSESGYDLILFLGMIYTSPLIVAAISLYVVHLVKAFKNAKGVGRIITLIPTWILVAAIVASSIGYGVTYALTDKATIGIPQEEQDKLNVSKVLEETKDRTDIAFYIKNEKGIDSTGELNKALRSLSISESPIEEPTIRGYDYSIQYELGTDDFYGFIFYDNGYIACQDHGDILCPQYDMYYSFDASQFNAVYEVAKALVTAAK